MFGLLCPEAGRPNIESGEEALGEAVKAMQAPVTG